MARESLPLHHPISLVGAILAMVHRQRSPPDRRGDKHATCGESETWDQDVAVDRMSRLGRESRPNGRGTGECNICGRTGGRGMRTKSS